MQLKFFGFKIYLVGLTGMSFTQESSIFYENIRATYLPVNLVFP